MRIADSDGNPPFSVSLALSDAEAPSSRRLSGRFNPLAAATRAHQ